MVLTKLSFDAYLKRVKEKKRVSRHEFALDFAWNADLLKQFKAALANLSRAALKVEKAKKEAVEEVKAEQKAEAEATTQAAREAQEKKDALKLALQPLYKLREDAIEAEDGWLAAQIYDEIKRLKDEASLP